MTRFLLLFLLLTLCACVSDDQRPVDMNDSDDPTPRVDDDLTGLELAEQSLGTDPQEVGSRWYDYSQRGHVLTPKPIVYQFLRNAEPFALLDIESYYDERGESGVFTFAYDVGEGVERVTLPSLKESERVCMDDTFSPISCTSQDVLFVARIAPRAVPNAGFAVKEPGLYLHQPYDPSAPTPRYTAERIEADSIDGLTLGSVRGMPTPSSYLPEHSRLGWMHPADEPGAFREDISLHATSTLHFAQWQITALRRVDERLEIDLKINCEKVEATGDAAFDVGAIETLTIDLSTASDYDGKALTLCEADEDRTPALATVDTFEAPPGALLGDEPFDLYVAQHEGRLLMRPAPGTLLLNWTRALGMGETTMGEMDLEAIWNQYVE